MRSGARNSGLRKWLSYTDVIFEIVTESETPKEKSIGEKKVDIRGLNFGMAPFRWLNEELEKE